MSTPDHQLARSTAEKIHTARKEPWGPDEFVMVTPDADQTAEIILASYHERDRAATAPHPLQSIIDGKRTPPDIDRAISDNLMALVEPAATAMGGETPFRGAFPVRAGHCKPDEIVVLKTQFNAVADDLTALQASNREVVAERDVALRDAGLYAGTLASTARQLGCEEHMVDHTLRSRLALADEMARALDTLRCIVGLTAFKHATQRSALQEALDQSGEAYRRWTAPQAGTTEIPQEFKDAMEDVRAGRLVDFDKATSGESPPSEPASRAVAITPELSESFPCWMLNQLIEPKWVHFRSRNSFILEGQYGRYTHYHPDQPLAPTCRPTATEGGV